MNVNLIFFSPDGNRRELSLEEGKHVVGRGSEAHLRIPMSSISRTHCEITLSNSDLKIRDLGSLNGTYKNKQRIEGTERLSPGDKVQIGECVCTVQIDGVPADVTSASGGAASSGESSMMDAPAVASGEGDKTTRHQSGSDDDDFDFDFDFDEDSSS